MADAPIIPRNITVHLGTPNSDAQNVTLPFPDYIKNVASSEIYPTWPESAIRANIYAQISFALNRVYTEWYRSRGYDFDITSTTAYDQSFVNERPIFENISEIVDDMFNSYVRRQGSVEPLFTAYCDGRQTDCEGLKQWGTVTLANEGRVPYEILQYYYGDDIDIVTNVNVGNNTPSYPEIPLREGDSSNDVQQIQVRLNRIARNYPGIPVISPADGNFGRSTTEAVKKFQQVFSLTPDGIVGNATWYKIIYIYSSVKQLAELDSEGIAVGEIPQRFARSLRLGDSGLEVSIIQYYLRVISNYYDTVPSVDVTGTFDTATDAAVRAFQQTYGLSVDGVVGRNTWNDIYRAYRGIVASQAVTADAIPLYPGSILSLGSEGEYVRVIQQWLSTLSETYTDIPDVSVNGVFDAQTDAAVRAFQRRFGITANGVVGAVTWDALASAYEDVRG